MDSKKIKNTLIDKWAYILIISFFIICFVYVFLYKDNVYIQIWDNLDSNVGLIKLIKDEGLLFSFDSEVPILGGINRSYFFSCLNIITWIYAIFPVYYAYIICWFLKIMISIIGMYILGKTIIDDNKNKNIYLFSGLLYGLASTHPFSSFGFATLPILLAILIKLCRYMDIKYLILLFIYPMFSDLFLFGAFICGFILVAFIIDLLINKKPKCRLLLAVLVLSLGYIIVNHRLLYLLLFSNTIRNDGVQIINNSSIYDLIKSIIDYFINGVNHASINVNYFILPLFAIYTIYLIILNIKNHTLKNLFKDNFIIVLLCILVNAVICGLDGYGPFKLLIGKIIPQLAEFSFQRAVWFNPLLWCLGLSIILTRIENKKIKTLIIIISLLSVICANGKYNELGANIRKIINLNSIDGAEYTYNEYYSEDLFNEIKNDIDYKNEWSIAFGMHPSILHYNDIYTLDGYLSYYPKEYKDSFREIIAPELLIDDEHRKYFDNSGIRVYVFSMETSYNTWKSEYNNTHANMYINTDAFKKMGGKYIFSRIEIDNYEELGLEFVKTYFNDKSPYIIYLYEC